MVIRWAVSENPFQELDGVCHVVHKWHLDGFRGTRGRLGAHRAPSVHWGRGLGAG